MSKNFDPRTGTVSLIPKKPVLKSPPKKYSDPGPKGLIIQRTHEEMTRLEREEALQDELMTLGLFGEMQTQPVLEEIGPQIQDKICSTDIEAEAMIENVQVELVEPVTPVIVEEPRPNPTRRGRRKKKS